MCASEWCGGEPAGCGVAGAPAVGQGPRGALVCCGAVLVCGSHSHTGRPRRLCSHGVWAPALHRVLISLGVCVCVYIYRHGTYLNEAILK